MQFSKEQVRVLIESAKEIAESEDVQWLNFTTNCRGMFGERCFGIIFERNFSMRAYEFTHSQLMNEWVEDFFWGNIELFMENWWETEYTEEQQDIAFSKVLNTIKDTHKTWTIGSATVYYWEQIKK